MVYAEIANDLAALSALLSLFAAVIGWRAWCTTMPASRSRFGAATSRDPAHPRLTQESSPPSCSESGLSVLLGVAPGLLLGRFIGKVWLSTVDRELLRIPLTLSLHSYVAAACVVLLAALLSALVVRRRSDHLDLVAVLKARD